jgi:hypothetical protein
MNKLIITGITLATTLGLGIAIATPAFATSEHSNGQGSGPRYGYDQQIEAKSKILGITVDELKKQLESKNLEEIAKSKGLNEDELHSQIQSAAQKRWKDRGLSDSEIKNRTEAMQKRQTECNGTGSSISNGNRYSNHVNQ